jgi:hypothetical protein
MVKRKTKSISFKLKHPREDILLMRYDENKDQNSF